MSGGPVRASYAGLALLIAFAAGCAREPASVAIELDPESVGAWLDSDEIAVRLESVEAPAVWRGARYSYRFRYRTSEPAHPAVFTGLEPGRYRLSLPDRFVYEPVMVEAKAGQRSTVRVPLVERGARHDFLTDPEGYMERHLFVDVDAGVLSWREEWLEIYRKPLRDFSSDVVRALRQEWLENGSHRSPDDRKFDQLVWVSAKGATERELLATARQLATGITREFRNPVADKLEQVPAFELRLLAPEDFAPEAVPPAPPPLAAAASSPANVEVTVSVGGRVPRPQVFTQALQNERPRLGACLASISAASAPAQYRYLLEPQETLQLRSVSGAHSARVQACVDGVLRAAMPVPEPSERATPLLVTLEVQSGSKP